jgi:hypothetical protein
MDSDYCQVMPVGLMPFELYFRVDTNQTQGLSNASLLWRHSHIASDIYLGASPTREHPINTCHSLGLRAAIYICFCIAENPKDRGIRIFTFVFGKEKEQNIAWDTTRFSSEWSRQSQPGVRNTLLSTLQPGRQSM